MRVRKCEESLYHRRLGTLLALDLREVEVAVGWKLLSLSRLKTQHFGINPPFVNNCCIISSRSWWSWWRTRFSIYITNRSLLDSSLLRAASTSEGRLPRIGAFDQHVLNPSWEISLTRFVIEPRTIVWFCDFEHKTCPIIHVQIYFCNECYS